jgi:hypothetical protein
MTAKFVIHTVLFNDTRGQCGPRPPVFRNSNSYFIHSVGLLEPGIGPSQSLIYLEIQEKQITDIIHLSSGKRIHDSGVKNATAVHSLFVGYSAPNGAKVVKLKRGLLVLMTDSRNAYKILI